jgi:hypothetical protein
MNRRAGLLLAALVVLALGAVLVWNAGSSTPDRSARNPSPSADRTGPTREPVTGAAPEPVVRAGRTTWLAPSPAAEAALPTVTGPLPESLAIDEIYPVLRPGDVQRAVMVLGVVGDTSTLQRLLVLDQSWQAFELELGGLGRTTGGLTLSRGGLSADGTRLALGEVESYVVLDLPDLTRRYVDVGPVSTRDLSWSDGSVVVEERPAVFGEPGSSRQVSLVVSGGVDLLRTEDAALRLDGPRPSECCAVAGWSRPGHVLYESRDGTRLRVLDWDTRSGRVARVSTIEPVVSNNWYLLTSYAVPGRVTQPRS